MTDLLEGSCLCGTVRYRLASTAKQFTRHLLVDAVVIYQQYSKTGQRITLSIR